MELKKIKPNVEYVYVDPRHGYWSRHHMKLVRFPVVVRGYRDKDGTWSATETVDSRTGLVTQNVFLKGEVFDGETWSEWDLALRGSRIHPATEGARERMADDWRRVTRAREEDRLIKERREAMNATLTRVVNNGVEVSDRLRERLLDDSSDDDLYPLVVVLSDLVGMIG